MSEQTAKLTKETFNAENFGFVDLGLPSGRRWAAENAPGHYTFDEAVEVFGDCLPKAAAMAELIEECQVKWNEEKKGLDITGPNGNSIFLPAAGFVSRFSGSLESADEIGAYWTRKAFVTPSESYASYSQAHAYLLRFNSGGVDPLHSIYRSYGFSVRPAREFD